MMRCLGGCPLNCWSSYRIGKRGAKKIKEVKDMHSKGTYEEVGLKTLNLPPRTFQAMPTATAVELNSYLEEVHRYLGVEGVGIVGIYGVGGVGKTTLLKRINNELNDGFEHVIWVVASMECSLEKLREDIAKSLGLKDFGVTSIFNFLKNKNFLFLLDDLWEDVDLDEIGIPAHARGNNHIGGKPRYKVIFTTRHMRVCANMEAHLLIQVNCLQREEAWRLFEKKVGRETLNSDHDIRSLAAIVVEECDGLPLALTTIGRVMSNKKNPREWEHVITLLQKSRLQEIPGVKEKSLTVLAYSYDILKESMKICILCCSLWPQGFNIPEDELIKCWIGLGLIEIDEYDEIEDAYNSGYFLIGRLRDACLLELGDYDCSNYKETVKMHDVIRDVALWIASECGKKKNKWMVLTPKEIEKWREAERISLTFGMVEALLTPPDCPNLLTLMLHDNSRLKIIPRAFFQHMPALTYLDLSHTAVRELPREIGTLVKLQHLDLSFTRISSLPNELGSLVELKYLFLRGCYECIIPHRVISRLLQLRVLDLGNVNMRCEDGINGEDSNVVTINELELLRLKYLEISIETVQALQRLCIISRMPMLCLSVRKLEDFVSSPQQQLFSPTLIGSRNVRRSLKDLLIESCSSLETLMMNGGNHVEEAEDFRAKDDWCLPRLEILSLSFLCELKEIIWSGVVPVEFFPSLRILNIYDCRRLKNVTWVLHLPCLEILSVQWCDRMEQLICDAEDGGIIGRVDVGEVLEETTIFAFPRLKKLELSSLPSLGSICSSALAFPCLVHVRVIKCPKLKKLPFRSDITQNN